MHLRWYISEKLWLDYSQRKTVWWTTLFTIRLSYYKFLMEETSSVAQLAMKRQQGPSHLWTRQVSLSVSCNTNTKYKTCFLLVVLGVYYVFKQHNSFLEISLGFCGKQLLVTDGLSNTRQKIRKTQYVKNLIRTFLFTKYSLLGFRDFYAILLLPLMTDFGWQS